MSSNTSIYLAPFQGITTFTYREVYSKYFDCVDKLFTPFFTGIQKPNSLAKRAYEFNFPKQNQVDVVPQILSKDTNEIIKFINLCDNKGFKEVNWNLGCPYPRVANKKRGSGMLPYPDMVFEILDEVMPNINIGLSIKCRLGYFHYEEIFELLKVYNSFNLLELIIHARLGKQLYTGDVNIDVLKTVIEKSKIPIAYNGDVFSKNDFNNFKKELPETDIWMIGRGLLVDPFLPMKIKGTCKTSLMEQKNLTYRFITDLYIAYRKKANDRLQAIGVIKELWGFMAYSFNEPQRVFNTIKKTSSFDEYEEKVAHVFKNFNWLGTDACLLRNRKL